MTQTKTGKPKTGIRTPEDEALERQAFYGEDDFHQGEEFIRFQFSDDEWAALTKLRLFDIDRGPEEMTARHALEDAVGKYVVQDLTGANSEEAIRLLRKLMPKLDVIRAINDELKFIVTRIEEGRVFNSFGQYQYGSAIDQSYFEHFDLFGKLMLRCLEEIDRPLTGPKSENVVALVSAIDDICFRYSSAGRLRRISKGSVQNDIGLVEVTFEFIQKRFKVSETSKGTIEKALRKVMDGAKNPRPKFLLRYG